MLQTKSPKPGAIGVLRIKYRGLKGDLESNSPVLYPCAIDSEWLDRCLFYRGAFNAPLVFPGRRIRLGADACFPFHWLLAR